MHGTYFTSEFSGLSGHDLRSSTPVQARITGPSSGYERGGAEGEGGVLPPIMVWS